MLKLTIKVDRAGWIAMQIRQNVEAFCTKHAISYEQFHARQAQLWSYACGKETHEAVLRAL
jgi:hypothetical protein